LQGGRDNIAVIIAEQRQKEEEKDLEFQMKTTLVGKATRQDIMPFMLGLKDTIKNLNFVNVVKKLNLNIYQIIQGNI